MWASKENLARLSKESLDKEVDNVCKMIKLLEQNNPLIRDLYNNIGAKFNFREDNLYLLEFMFSESSDIGIAVPHLMMESYMLFNTLYLENANCPEVIIATMLAHEFSHLKSKQLFSLIDENDIPKKYSNKTFEILKKTIKANNNKSQEFKDSLKGTDTYKIIKENYLNDLEEIHKEMNSKHLDASKKINNITKKISTLCGLTFLEISTIELYDILTSNEIKKRDSIFNQALCSDEQFKTIKLKVEKHLPEVRKILEQNNYSKLIEVIEKNYVIQKDEIRARYNTLRILKELIHENIITIKDQKLLKQILATPLKEPEDIKFIELQRRHK